MSTVIALSAIGRDRPGIVAGLTKVLFELGCNLEETSMTRLRNDFAMILLIAVPEGKNADDLRDAMRPVISEFGLTMDFRVLNDCEAKANAAAQDANYILSVYGIDKPGIVYTITKMCAEHNINITELGTQVSENQGQPLYALFLEVYIPEFVSIIEISEQLKKFGAQLSVDVSLEPLLQCGDF
ncbi:MAG: amino acid-binding protein [Candidatus Auribacter fodinae]|jgi:glycine cleavage system transcriptional repressor|uniref:Amino acid-binding protein n=1 Tax=Candidatus Auribacter fodinae TaxID=2093366 RepID=A0A3A4QWU2_9BACT|nr:MAG: amino acid-binding protein [Candidatus Auribacter fodinae]